MIYTPEAKLFDLRMAAYKRNEAEVVAVYSTTTSLLARAEVAIKTTPKLVYYGIKALSFFDRTAKFDDQYERFALMQSVLISVGGLSPREFMQIFPIDKEFDGNKYGIRDYFSAMDEAVNANGIDLPIESPFEFLMNYWNRDVMDFVVNMTSTMSNISRIESGKGILKRFMDEQRGDNQ